MLKDTLSIRLNPKTKEKLENLATAECRDTSDYCRFLLERFAQVTVPAQIAIIQILKEGSNQERAEQILDFLLKDSQHIEIDRIALRKLAQLLEGK